MPITFSNGNKMHYSPAPKLGEHTRDILEGIGFNKKNIRELLSEGVIVT